MGLLFFIIVLLVGGFIVGGLARWAVPGPDPMPVWATVALGLGGSIVGGIVARILIGTAGGFLFAFLGAVLLLILYRHFVQHRPLTGPGARRPPT
ncbi:MAG: GlsB/YeaQ/YmgE family stress response membrane protein [Actinobacteria bacterium]|nr:MAG: GlsB/YeaQ/YmgE family stress response membrane protein [Actinomycetota bacterium]